MISSLRVVLVDDELLARQRLTRLCAHIPDVEVVGAFERADAAIEYLRTDDVDALLLDIRMPGLSGIDLTRLLPAGAPYIIFVTAHRSHAVDAFDAGAIDYVLKPVDGARLRLALDRARRAIGSAARGSQRLPIHTRRGIVLVAPEDITHASFDGQLVTVHAAGAAHLTDMTLAELTERLDAPGFERANRRCIMNMAHVERLEPTPSGTLHAVLGCGTRVVISRQIGRELRRRLGAGRSPAANDHSPGPGDRSP